MRTILCLLASFGLGAALAQSPVNVTVETRSRVAAVPAEFAGLSFETKTLLPDGRGGHLFSPTNTALITLFQNVGLKHLRIGGARWIWPG